MGVLSSCSASCGREPLFHPPLRLLGRTYSLVHINTAGPRLAARSGTAAALAYKRDVAVVQEARKPKQKAKGDGKGVKDKDKTPE